MRPEVLGRVKRNIPETCHLYTCAGETSYGVQGICLVCLLLLFSPSTEMIGTTRDTSARQRKPRPKTPRQEICRSFNLCCTVLVGGVLGLDWCCPGPVWSCMVLYGTYYRLVMYLELLCICSCDAGTSPSAVICGYCTFRTFTVLLLDCCYCYVCLLFAR